MRLCHRRRCEHIHVINAHSGSREGDRRVLLRSGAASRSKVVREKTRTRRSASTPSARRVRRLNARLRRCGCRLRRSGPRPDEPRPAFHAEEPLGPDAAAAFGAEADGLCRLRLLCRHGDGFRRHPVPAIHAEHVSGPQHLATGLTYPRCHDAPLPCPARLYSYMPGVSGSATSLRLR